MAADRPIVSRATRNAVRRLMSSLYVAAIAEYWEGENFARSEIANPRQGGVRQQTFDAYETSVDWTDQEHARRGLLVFETLLRRLDRDSKKSGAQGIDPTELEDLREALSTTVTFWMRICACNLPPPQLFRARRPRPSLLTRAASPRSRAGGSSNA